MKRRILVNLLTALALMLATFASLSTGLGGGALAARQTRAQGPTPPEGDMAQANLGTAFTYQGRLTDTSGNPIAGPCTLRFTLYGSAGGSDQVGSPQVQPGVTLDNGYFSVDLDFGASAFNGEARYMKIEVDCGSGYTLLNPRVELNPAPYALALPGLRTQQNATSPNVIGGYSGNSVSTLVVGATIGGGGASGAGNANSVTADYGTVGGGQGNIAAVGYAATVGGGQGNTAYGYATVGGGQGNTASGGGATVGGGLSNTTSAAGATVGGGQGNAASGDRATVGGGEGNTASSYAATVGGGLSNTASSYATVGGGLSNTASGLYATVPGGYNAHASLYGQMAYASGSFAASGDAQASLYVMRATTISGVGTWNGLYLNGSSALLTVAPNHTLTFDILVVGRSNAGESAGYYIWGVIENAGGITTGSAVTFPLRDDDGSWNAQAVADDTNDALSVQVMGNGETIRWVATVRTAEVAW